MFLKLKALGLVLLLFLGVYVPSFAVVALIKPGPQAAVPLIIGLSLVIALSFICLACPGTRKLSQFGIAGASYRSLGMALVLGVPIGLALTFVASRFSSTNPFGDITLRPWMIFLYFIVGAPVQEELIFRGLLQTTLAFRFAGDYPLLGTSVSSAVLIIAALFGVIHLAIGAATAMTAFVLGLLAGELRRRSGSLLPAIVLHALFNASSAVWQ